MNKDRPIAQAMFRQGLDTRNPFPDVIMIGPATLTEAMAQDGHGGIEPDFKRHADGRITFHNTRVEVDPNRKGWAFAQYRGTTLMDIPGDEPTACKYALDRRTGWTIVFESEPQ